MVRSKNETEDKLLLITENCETLIKQTHTKPQQTIEFEINRHRETFFFRPPSPIEGCWMIGLIISEENNSIFNITEEKNKFEHYTDKFDEF